MSITVFVDQTVLQKAEEVAAANRITVPEMIEDYLQTLAISASYADRESARRLLVQEIRAMTKGLVVGERPTRERTYRGGCIH